MSSPARPLTIGIDARAAVEVPAGRGRVVRELLRELSARPDEHSYVCYARTAWPETLDDRFTWELIEARDPWWHLRAARRASRRCDVFLSTNSYLTGWFLTIPDVVFVYDLLAFDRAMRPNLRSALVERLTMGVAVRRAAAFVCHSQATADALRRRFPRSAARITVAPLAARPTGAPGASASGRDALDEDEFVLAVGTLEPRKNLPRLVQAYRRLPDDLTHRHRLVIVGPEGWRTRETEDALDAMGDRVVRTGFVSDERLGELYRSCAVFAYPSLGEGFGLPVLEAMASGAAVLTSNVSSLPEVGGDAVAYCDPYDVADIANALGRLLTDHALRDDFGARAQARATEFSWARFAEATLQALENAAGSASAP